MVSVLFLRIWQIEFAVDDDFAVGIVYPSVPAGPYNDFVGRFLNAGQVAFVEPFSGMDVEHMIAFMDEAGTELPEFFKPSVAVEDGGNVGRGVICGDAKIVVHGNGLLLRFEFCVNAC